MAQDALQYIGVFLVVTDRAPVKCYACDTVLISLN
jgi:hypothetical protein